MSPSWPPHGLCGAGAALSSWRGQRTGLELAAPRLGDRGLPQLRAPDTSRREGGSVLFWLSALPSPCLDLELQFPRAVSIPLSGCCLPFPQPLSVSSSSHGVPNGLPGQGSGGFWVS